MISSSSPKQQQQHHHMHIIINNNNACTRSDRRSLLTVEVIRLEASSYWDPESSAGSSSSPGTEPGGWNPLLLTRGDGWPDIPPRLETEAIVLSESARDRACELDAEDEDDENWKMSSRMSPSRSSLLLLLLLLSLRMTFSSSFWGSYGLDQVSSKIDLRRGELEYGWSFAAAAATVVDDLQIGTEPVVGWVRGIRAANSSLIWTEG